MGGGVFTWRDVPNPATSRMARRLPGCVPRVGAPDNGQGRDALRT